MRNRTLFVCVIAVTAVLCARLSSGGVRHDGEEGKFLELGGRIQLQYHLNDPEGGPGTDELQFRRLRPYIEGSVHENWKGKFQFDLGKGDIALKDAYFKYGGFDAIDITIGNANFCFSRELLTSSKKQQLVERTFVGDHNYGTPDRQAGVHVGGKLADGMLAWNAAAAKAAIDPDNKKLDFDTVIQFDAGNDWLEGNMFGARLELFPLGYFKPSQGDFERDTKAAFGLAAFTWNNDDDHINTADDNTISSKDVDSVTGVEISAALRVAGFSIDAEYNVFDAELVNGKAGMDGIYQDGETSLENYAVEGGYMIIPSRLELVVGHQSQDADGYAKAWDRTSVGANVFVAKHHIKYQATYRMGKNKDGGDGMDVTELFVQAQYVF